MTRNDPVRKCQPRRSPAARDASGMFSCHSCSRSYATVKSRNDHVNKYHKDRSFSCHHCGFITKYRTNMCRHVKTHISGNSNRPEYPCVLCPPSSGPAYRTHQRPKMLEHYADKHEVMIVPKTFDFKNDDDFKAWKARIEKVQQCVFVAASGSKTSMTKMIRRFRCFRDGFYYSRGEGKRRLKLNGSSKIGGVCPASIVASQDRSTGDIRVTFIDTHVGHFKEVTRLTLSREERFEIAQKIAAQVPFETILNDVQKVRAEKGLERVNLLTRKDLWNIAASFNLSKSVAKESKQSNNIISEMGDPKPSDLNSEYNQEVEQNTDGDHSYFTCIIIKQDPSSSPVPESDEISDLETVESAHDPPQPQESNCHHLTTSRFDLRETAAKDTKQSVFISEPGESKPLDQEGPIDCNSECHLEVEQIVDVVTSYDMDHSYVSRSIKQDPSGFPGPEPDETSGLETVDPDPPQPQDSNHHHPTSSSIDLNGCKVELRRSFENILDSVTCISHAEMLRESLRSVLSAIREN